MREWPLRRGHDLIIDVLRLASCAYESAHCVSRADERTDDRGVRVYRRTRYQRAIAHSVVAARGCFMYHSVNSVQRIAPSKRMTKQL